MAIPSESRSLGLYLKDIANSNLLTQIEERDLAVRIRAGDKKSFERMITSNLRFVITIAKEYQGRGVLLEDLIAEGNAGLVRATTRYDETIGVKFTTYAVWWIRQGILSALTERTRMVRIPVNRIKLLAKIERAMRDLRQDLLREPTAEEVAATTELSSDAIYNLVAASRWHLSLDVPVDDDPGISLKEILEDKNAISPEGAVIDACVAQELMLALDTLSPREARVLRLYFGIGSGDEMTLEHIGAILNLTKERARQIRDKALSNLKHPARSKRLRTLVEPPISPVPKKYNGTHKNGKPLEDEVQFDFKFLKKDVPNTRRYTPKEIAEYEASQHKKRHPAGMWVISERVDLAVVKLINQYVESHGHLPTKEMVHILTFRKVSVQDVLVIAKKHANRIIRKQT